MSDINITIHTDGGSRGNPGQAAIGVYIPGYEKEYSEYLGVATNNEAEYNAAIFGLKKIKQLLGKDEAKHAHILIKADSELMVKQLNGEYKMKEEKLIPLFIEIWNLKQEFKKVDFVHIMREENKRADAMVNKELDSQAAKNKSKLF